MQGKAAAALRGLVLLTEDTFRMREKTKYARKTVCLELPYLALSWTT